MRGFSSKNLARNHLILHVLLEPLISDAEIEEAAGDILRLFINNIHDAGVNHAIRGVRQEIHTIFAWARMEIARQQGVPECGEC